MNITLRTALPEDEAFLLELYAANRPELGSTDDPRHDELVRMEYAALKHSYRIHYPGAAQSIVSVDGQTAGALTLVRTEAELGIIDAALLPAYQGRGLGTQLLRNVQSEAAETGKIVRAQARLDSTAERVLQELGFERLGENGIYSYLEWAPVKA